MRLHRFRPSLRLSLSVIFFCFATLCAVAIGVLWTHSAWNREMQTVQDQHLQLANHLAEALSRYAEDTEAVFHLAVANLVQQQPVRQLGILLERLHFKHVCIVNEQGRVEASISPYGDMHLERIPETLLTKLQDDHQAHPAPLSSVLPDRHGAPTLYLWYPLKPRQYALGALQTTYFRELQKAISFGVKGHAAIVDRSGRIIAHPLAQWQAEMKDISQLDPIRRMIAGETGVSWFYSPAVRADMVAGFTTVPKTGWGVMVPQPLSELQARVQEVKRTTWSVVGLILLASAIVGWLISKRFTSHLHRIGDAAERFAKGDYEVRALKPEVLQTREVETLSTQFDLMADDVVRSWQAQCESEERFREFAQIAADWFWETNMEQVFTYMSPMPQTGRHLDAESYIGRHRREFVCNDPEDQVTSLIQDHMDREAPFDQVPITIQGCDGEPIHVVVSGRPMRNADGVVTGYRGVVRDVTERMQIEALQREIKEVEETRRAQKMEAMGVLAGGLAHDFNNSLGIILGYAELTLQMVPENGPEWQNLQQIYTAGEHAKHIVQQVLTFSRKSDPERQPVYLHEIVEEALKLLRASLPTTIDIYHDIPMDIKDVVLADQTEIHQVLMNLGANAEHAMRDAGGVLEVGIDVVDIDETWMEAEPGVELRPGPHVRLSMRDTGHGMTADVAERIFEPYFTTKEMGEGTGMGLAVVHGIIASHGGAVTVQSTPETGTAFVIYLPQIDVEIERELTMDSELLQGHKETILFVDDEEVLTLLMQEMLKQLGYEVEARTSSLEALAVFRAAPERFDLVITDQTMPLMPGDVLAQELRAIRPEIPMILCTGHSHTMDAEKAAAKGFDAFCMKPLVMNDLGLVIRRVLARRAAGMRAK